MIEPFFANCTSIFGDENGTLVYEFYRYALHNIKGGTGSQNNKRLKHLLAILDWAPQDQFLKAVITLNDRFYGDTYKKKMSEQYFRTTLERMVYGATKIDLKTKEVQTAAAPMQISSATITPVRYKLNREDLTPDYLNYLYECSCKKIIDPWTTKCTCGKIIDWSSFENS